MNNKLIIDNFQNDFTKIHTKMNKGIAILFMAYYHLFVLHNNLDVTYLSLPDLVVPNIHYYLANFGKICVCIYCFLSGIGAFYSQQNAKIIDIEISSMLEITLGFSFIYLEFNY